MTHRIRVDFVVDDFGAKNGHVSKEGLRPVLEVADGGHLRLGGGRFFAILYVSL